MVLVQPRLELRHYAAHVNRLADAASGTHADGIDCRPRSHGHDDDWYAAAVWLLVTRLHERTASHVGNVQTHQDGIGYAAPQALQSCAPVGDGFDRTFEL